jgi:hypothetical protein
VRDDLLVVVIFRYQVVSKQCRLKASGLNKASSGGGLDQYISGHSCGVGTAVTVAPEDKSAGGNDDAAEEDGVALCEDTRNECITRFVGEPFCASL